MGRPVNSFLMLLLRPVNKTEDFNMGVVVARIWHPQFESMGKI